MNEKDLFDTPCPACDARAPWECQVGFDEGPCVKLPPKDESDPSMTKQEQDAKTLDGIVSDPEKLRGLADMYPDESADALRACAGQIEELQAQVKYLKDERAVTNDAIKRAIHCIDPPSSFKDEARIILKEAIGQ